MSQHQETKQGVIFSVGQSARHGPGLRIGQRDPSQAISAGMPQKINIPWLVLAYLVVSNVTTAIQLRSFQQRPTPRNSYNWSRPKCRYYRASTATYRPQKVQNFFKNRKPTKFDTYQQQEAGYWREEYIVDHAQHFWQLTITGSNEKHPENMIAITTTVKRRAPWARILMLHSSQNSIYNSPRQTLGHSIPSHSHK